MEAYSDFASVYDIFMDETPYTEWADHICGLLERQGIEKGLLLELGCGTGSLTEILADRGYDMIGVDFSQEMLNVALEKKERSGLDILYLCQDMREFELYGTVAAVVSVCDSINYLLDTEDIVDTFRLVNNYLDPGGIFLFDFNTDYKYREIIGDTVIAENRENCSFIWENFYDSESGINEYDLTIFVEEEQEGPQKGMFHRFTETHLQRGYDLAGMKEMLQKAGLVFVEAYDAATMGAPDEKSERILIVSKEDRK